MDKKQLITLTTSFVKETLEEAEGGHDWFHIERVHNNAKLIARSSLSENSSTKLPKTKPRIPPIGPAKVHPKPAPSHFEKFAIYNF